jgi:hypothetical protein
MNFNDVSEMIFIITVGVCRSGAVRRWDGLRVPTIYSDGSAVLEYIIQLHHCCRDIHKSERKIRNMLLNHHFNSVNCKMEIETWICTIIWCQRWMQRETEKEKLNWSMDRVTAKQYFSGLDVPGTFMALRWSWKGYKCMVKSIYRNIANLPKP